MTEARAPGVLKLLGEHAVVYGKPFVGITVDFFATASVTDIDSGNFVINLKDFGKSFELSTEKLEALYVEYKNRKDINAFLALPDMVDREVLPYAVIAARMLVECSTDLAGKQVNITSTIPKQSGCASSAACSTAMTVALSKLPGSEQSHEVLVDIARDGERVTHKNDGAGRIDVNPSYFGGVVSYSQASGIQRENIKTALDVVVINTGPKKSTAEMVAKVAEQYKTQTEKTKTILDNIEKCTLSGLEALKKGDMEKLGYEMLADHELLKSLGLSTEGLDKAVLISVQNGAYGAKLSGGGGGGIAIAIAPDPKRVIAAMKEMGFDAFSAKLTTIGALS